MCHGHVASTPRRRCRNSRTGTEKGIGGIRLHARTSGGFSISPECLPLVIGLTFFWPALKQFVFAGVLGGRPVSAGAMWLAPLVVSAAFGVLSVVAIFARRTVEPLFLRHRIATACVACCGSAGYLLLYASVVGNDEGGFSHTLFFAGCLLLAAGYLATALAYCSALCSIDAHDAIICLIVSFFLSSVVSLAALLPRVVAFWLAVASPLVSGLALLLVKAPARSGIDYSLSGIRSMPILPVLMLGLFLMTSKIAIGFFYDASAWVTARQRFLNVALVLASMVWIAVAVARFPPSRWEGFFKVGWTLLAVAAIAGVLLLFPEGDGYTSTGIGLLGAVFDCCELFLWINLTLAVRSHGVSSVLVFGCAFTAFKMVPNMVGKQIVPSMTAFHDTAGQGSFTAVAIAMVVLLVAVTVIYLTTTVFSMQTESPQSDGAKALDPQALGQSRPGDGPVSDSRSSAIAELSSRHSLTLRESDVLDYLSQGFSYQAIADALGISPGTAQGYAKGVYRKMNVHSKQELINLVRRQADGEQALRSGDL